MVITFSYLDSSTTPNLIYFDVQVSGYGPNVGYPGFVLLDPTRRYYSYENFNTAGNVYTAMSNALKQDSWMLFKILVYHLMDLYT